jgi:hypothetical protein
VAPPGLAELSKKGRRLVIVDFRGSHGPVGYLLPLGFALKGPDGKRLGCIYYRSPRSNEEWQGHFDPISGDFSFESLFMKSFGSDFEMEFLFAVDAPVTPEWSLVYSDQPFFSPDRKVEESYKVTKGVIRLKSE